MRVRKSKSKQNGPIQNSLSLPSALGNTLVPAKFTSSSIGDGIIRYRGHELLGVVNFINGTGDYRIAGLFDLNPACWTNSRLARVASTYEKYRYDGFTIRYHPVVGTDVSASVAMYVELEAEEPITPSPIIALNHQHSVLGPIWSTMAVSYKRPAHDPTVYFLTATSTQSREQTTQARVAVLGDVTNHTGYISIEYDIVFMYPELEVKYAGQQYEAATATCAVAAANAPLVFAPVWDSVGVKVAEVVLSKDLPDSCYSFAPLNSYSFKSGDKMYTAWDGNNWVLFENLASALALDNILKWTTGVAAFTVDYYVRRLLKN